MAENIVHLVLARVTGAPEGVKGISLFVVPKFMVGKDGALGARNDVHCVSIEHKMGIKASPTAVLQYGDHGGAVGYHRRRRKPRPRVHVHHDELGAATPSACRASRLPSAPTRRPWPFHETACRAVGSTAPSRPARPSSTTPRRQAHADDHARLHRRLPRHGLPWPPRYDATHHHPDAEVRKQNQAFYEFMVPLVKGYSTEMSLEVTSLGVQVHGGMGFIEETGAAQYYRDAKILTIYEGTTAIQANDLIGRKTSRDGGQTAKAIAGQIEKTESRTAQAGQRRRGRPWPNA